MLSPVIANNRDEFSYQQQRLILTNIPQTYSD
jgi:hypothetical protein